MNHLTQNVAQTERVAADLARSLHAGDCITLEGDLGAGKTQFVRGLVRGLGGDERAVSSPTFVLLNVYDTPRMKVFHLDAYRVGGADDFETIGFAELLEQNGVVCVEWPKRVEEILPPIESRIRVAIKSAGRTSRSIQILMPQGESLARALHLTRKKETDMPQGDKTAYTSKQKRQAKHIEESYEKRGVPKKEAERRAWATENASSGGGKKSGSGRGRATNKAPSEKGGRKGGAASAGRSAASKSKSAKKAAKTRDAKKS